MELLTRSGVSAEGPSQTCVSAARETSRRRVSLHGGILVERLQNIPTPELLQKVRPLGAHGTHALLNNDKDTHTFLLDCIEPMLQELCRRGFLIQDLGVLIDG
jgi:hypothetical protein